MLASAKGDRELVNLLLTGSLLHAGGSGRHLIADGG